MVSEPPTSARPSRARLDRVFHALRWPARAWGRTFERTAGILARRVGTGSPRILRAKRVLAVLVLLYAAFQWILYFAHGELPSLTQVLIAVLGFALYTNRGGRFVRDWLPVLAVAVLYLLADQAVNTLKLSVFYRPQIDADRILGLGTDPTVWLQSHLYHGHVGALEIFTAIMYLSHFLAPPALAFGLWAFWSKRAFSDLLFGVLIVMVMSEITFVLVPTAPPWMAAEHGVLPHIHPILKDALYSLHMDQIASAIHSGGYDMVAAVPSLHAAVPTIGLLVVRKHRLPRAVVGLQAAILLGIVFSIVYLGEHYVVDALAGAVYALAAWWVLQRALAADVAPAVRPVAVA